MNLNAYTPISTRQILRPILWGMTLFLLIGALFFVFMRSNEDKSILWLSAAHQVQDNPQMAHFYLTKAIVHDPYNSHLWAMVQSIPFSAPESFQHKNAAQIQALLEGHSIPKVPKAKP